MFNKTPSNFSSSNNFLTLFHLISISFSICYNYYPIFIFFQVNAQIYEEVKKCIEDAAKGGGYILTSSNSIHYNVPAKNLIYMVEAARKFGRY
ncbi:MAG: uroporphyrinogen decarboxylase family protein [Candidatus Ratteibacteria bacterium]